MAALKTAEVLAFERKLANSDAVMSSGCWNDRDNIETWQAIDITTKSVRGTISNRLKNAIASDPLKLDNEIQKANLQTVDVAALPFDHDTLKLEFTLRILGNLSTPSACNKPAYQAALGGVINAYIEQHQFLELAKRYAINLANGRFLWRNRVGAETINVQVEQLENQAIAKHWSFNAHDYSLRDFNSDDENIASLTEVIQQGLLGHTFVFLRVKAFARLGEGQEVFPSEELILDKGNTKGGKSKTLYQLNGNAGMHSQKVGNALRTIDTWYPEAEQFGPISIEPFGSVTNRGTAYRQPAKKIDFYNLLDKWVLKDQAPENNQQHYVMATLIRGGVFGEKSE